MIFEKVYGIDLGNSSVKIITGTPGSVYTEKNIIASKGREIIAVGDEAYAMLGKQPMDIRVKSPMAFGMIAELELQEIVLYTMLTRMGNTQGLRSVIYFTAPPDMSPIEKRAYYYVANGHWMRQNRVFLVESPMAEAIALGINPDDNTGNMIVNIGSESTSFAIIADGRIIISRKLQTGGKQITEAICAEIRSTHHLQIGYMTGRKLKNELGSLSDDEKKGIKVIGIDSVSGLPREEMITSDVVKAGILNSLSGLASEMKTFLERIPPQIAMHIKKEGVYLTGGTARLPELHQYLADYTGFAFNLPNMYEKSCIRGLGKIIEDKELRRFALPVTERRL